MASTDVAEQILELLKKSPGAIAAIQRVLNTFCSVNITKPDPGELFLTNEDQYMALRMGALDYAISPMRSYLPSHRWLESNRARPHGNG